jgi:hypothetical protein
MVAHRARAFKIRGLTNPPPCDIIKKNKGENNMKVWGFNCYGVCIVRIEKKDIGKWNENHAIASQKIVSWKE